MRTTKTQNKRINRGWRRLPAILIALLVLCPNIRGQVTIGQGEAPVNGALLQLKDKPNISGKSVNATKGLGMPRVELTSETDLFPMYASDGASGYVGATKAVEDPKHTGLMVYNLTDSDPFAEGVYVWDGTKWLAVGSGGTVDPNYCPPTKTVHPITDIEINCYVGIPISLIAVFISNAHDISNISWYYDDGEAIASGSGTSLEYLPTASDNGRGIYARAVNDCGNSVKSSLYKLNIKNNPFNDADDGMYTDAVFYGQSCFDINVTDNPTFCGTSEFRQNRATDFDGHAAIEYMFKTPATGTTSDLLFIIEDPAGIISNYSTNAPDGTLTADQEYTLYVKYKDDLGKPTGNPNAIGRTYDTGLKLTLWASFTYEGTSYALSIPVTIMDCACCLGMVMTQGELLPTAKNGSSTITDYKRTGRDICVSGTQSEVSTGYTALSTACLGGASTLQPGIGWRAPSLYEMIAIYVNGNNLTVPGIPETTNLYPTIGSTGTYYWGAYSKIIDTGSSDMGRIEKTGSMSTSFGNPTGYYFRCVRPL